jgi:hypothetical protein
MMIIIYLLQEWVTIFNICINRKSLKNYYTNNRFDQLLLIFLIIICIFNFFHYCYFIDHNIIYFIFNNAFTFIIKYFLDIHKLLWTKKLRHIYLSSQSDYFLCAYFLPIYLFKILYLLFMISKIIKI